LEPFNKNLNHRHHTHAMSEKTKRVKDTAGAASFPLITYDPGDWQPVYKSRAELDAAMNAFSEAVSADVCLFAEARRYSEELLMRRD
jgi:hypothetical protein